MDVKTNLSPFPILEKFFFTNAAGFHSRRFPKKFSLRN
jgi:hypothetical protein